MWQLSHAEVENDEENGLRVTGPKGHGSEWSLVPNPNPNPNSNSNGSRNHNANVTLRTSDLFE